MGAPSDYFVDPAGGNDSTGDGSIGTPWKTVQHALDNITRDTTDGDRINVRDTAADTLGAALSLASYGTPSGSVPLAFQGYSATQGDGGIGVIHGGGLYTIIAGTPDGLVFMDMHLTQAGDNLVLATGADLVLFDVEVSLGNLGLVSAAGRAAIVNCHGRDAVAGPGFEFANGHVSHCFVDGVGGYGIAHLGAQYGAITFNVVTGCTDGIKYRGGYYAHNTIWSPGGSGTGLSPHFAGQTPTILNNLVAGFSGSGGKGIELGASDSIQIYGGNRYYDNETNEDLSGDVWLDVGGNQVLTSDPLVDPASDDFRVNVLAKGKALPALFKGSPTPQFLDAGAAQRIEKFIGSPFNRGLF